jgi:hypothetical protein
MPTIASHTRAHIERDAGEVSLIDPDFEPEDMLTADMGKSEQLLASVAIDFKSQHAGAI